MSVVEDRVLTQDVFEELARSAIRAEEVLRLEFVNGKLGVKGSRSTRSPTVCATSRS
ncbi:MULTISPECIES: hypothetical protein [unclassified Streptomyces]|uniref:hypothetical protein n=1 Tax=unclassified Streptomyces TaxID=2593676 RepID=UPI00344E4AC1